MFSYIQPETGEDISPKKVKKIYVYLARKWSRYVYVPRKVEQMYSEIWFPDLLDSEK